MRLTRLVQTFIHELRIVGAIRDSEVRSKRRRRHGDNGAVEVIALNAIGQFVDFGYRMQRHAVRAYGERVGGRPYAERAAFAGLHKGRRHDMRMDVPAPDASHYAAIHRTCLSSIKRDT